MSEEPPPSLMSKIGGYFYLSKRTKQLCVTKLTQLILQDRPIDFSAYYSLALSISLYHHHQSSPDYLHVSPWTTITIFSLIQSYPLILSHPTVNIKVKVILLKHKSIQVIPPPSLPLFKTFQDSEKIIRQRHNLTQLTKLLPDLVLPTL